MNCNVCNLEMLYGNIHLTANVLERLFGDGEHLSFEDYNPKSKAITLVEFRKPCNGFYCANCGDVYLNSEKTDMNCVHCNKKMSYGNFFINRGMTKFNYTHFDFILPNQNTFKILNQNQYVRGHYCLNCESVYFNINEII